MRIKSLFLLPLLFLLFLTVKPDALAQDYVVPQRTEDNVIVASYNVKFFGEHSHDLDKLAIVIENFDICGILEVIGESSVPDLVQALETKTGKDCSHNHPASIE